MSQAQYSVTEQLYELIDIANQHGLYDAADWIQRTLESRQYQSHALFLRCLENLR